MTYRELSDVLGIKIDSAKALRRRRKWKLSISNSSRESLVNVPESYLETIQSTVTMDSPIATDVTTYVTTEDNDKLRFELIEQIALAHESIGELKLKLSISEALNEKLGDIENENTILKKDREKQISAMFEMKFRIKELERAQETHMKKKKWWHFATR